MRLFKPPRWTDRIFPRYTWRFLISEPTIFLTFDDGPNPEITPFVLDLLKRYNWKATFFCVGENIERYPEIAERIRNEGHEIGNHTQQHVNAFRVSREAYLDSYRAFENHSPTRLFRPPYGRIKKSLAEEILPTHKIILWSWLSYDYDLSVSNKTILKEVERVKKGDILVLHDNAKIAERQKILLPELFKKLAEMGFESKVILP